jgi:hypothetical protein
MDDLLQRAPELNRTWLLDGVNLLPLDRTEKLRLHHFTIFLLMGLPVMVAFGGYHLLAGNALLGGVSLAMAACLGLGRVAVGRSQLGLAMYRINAALFAGMLLYMLAIGDTSGSKSLWLMTFPLITNFLLGRGEGTAWSLLVFLAAALMLAGVPVGVLVHSYEPAFALRFSLVFLIITAVAHWFEFLRQHYRHAMENEQGLLLEERARLQIEVASRVAAEQAKEALILELREEMSKVKMLRGLLPICASCKKIRDQEGQWLPVETYVRERSEASFTHGICPDCSQAFRNSE